MERTPVLIGIVGCSGVGKTTLLEQVIPALEAKGLLVGTVKHASKDLLANQPGKDSYRLYQAGAWAVALASREQAAVFHRSACGFGADPELQATLRSLPKDLDVVVVEGFSWAPIPRVVLVQEGQPPRKEFLTRGSVLGILWVSPPSKGEKPAFPPHVVARVVDDVVRHVRSRGSLSEGASNSPSPRPGRTHDAGTWRSWNLQT
jgi:molybdopterin-guanine dinucleotide biosynthesis protein B